MLPIRRAAWLFVWTLGSAHAFTTSLDGSSWRLNLNVGREKGTWMPKEWASSGARLLLPMDVTFSGEPLGDGYSLAQRVIGLGFNDLGPIENTRRLDCSGGTFVGAQGQVRVDATGGAWSETPTGRCGESVVRFYVDFPNGATRNDVSIPAGRVYFNSACWDGTELRAALAEATECEARLDTLRAEQVEGRERDRRDDPNVLEQAGEVRASMARADEFEKLKNRLAFLKQSLPDRRGSLDGPRGVQIAGGGGVSVKANGAVNLFGALGDVYHVLGRFDTKPAEAPP